jgi:hypothetical protein
LASVKIVSDLPATVAVAVLTTAAAAPLGAAAEDAGFEAAPLVEDEPPPQAASRRTDVRAAPSIAPLEKVRVISYLPCNRTVGLKGDTGACNSIPYLRGVLHP